MTAEQILQQEDVCLNDSYKTDYIINQMKEFAKFHVEKALKAANKNVKIIKGETIYMKHGGSITGDSKVDENSIINAYPLNKIK